MIGPVLRGRWSVRLRLTLLYTALFVAAGAVLLTINFVLVRHRERSAGRAIACHVSGTASTPPTMPFPPPAVLPSGCNYVPNAQGGGLGGNISVPAPPDQSKVNVALLAVRDTQNHALHTLLVESTITLGLMALVSLALGWVMAGRVLRPVHLVTDTARRLSQETLHERIGMTGPADELKELADTFDAMLDRLEGAFDSQRRFVANASHELRTPLATERVLIDEALAHRAASVSELRAILEQLRANSEVNEDLIDGLLVLARSERGIDRSAETDLAALARDAIAQIGDEAARRAVSVRSVLAPAPMGGDVALLARLVANLVDNAVHHNRASGWLEVTTGSEGADVFVRVANSGLGIEAGDIPRLFEPFTRAEGERVTSTPGLGLGLSIVAAVAAAHGGRVDATPGDDGGIVVTVRFRRVDAPS